MTAIQELIKELDYIKLNKCSKLQEIVFFDFCLSFIEGKYLELEKQMILDAFNSGKNQNIENNQVIADDYYKQISG